MQRISYYIIAVVALGVLISSVWVYQRYFQSADQAFLYFTVDRGDIEEAVKVRGEVAAEKEFELEFPFSGTIKSIVAREGDIVPKGQRLMSMETKDLETERHRLAAIVIERKTDLAKLLSGATIEDVKVSESKVANALIVAEEAKKNLVDKIKDAYTKSDDAVRAKTDQLFRNPHTADPALLTELTVDDGVRSELNQERRLLETLLTDWSKGVFLLSASGELSTAISTAKRQTVAVSTFLNTLSPVVSGAVASTNLSQTTIDKYNTDVSTARTNVNAAIAGLVAAEEKLKLAEANIALTQNELALKRAPARSEDVTIAETRINEAQSQLDAVDEKIRRSTLLAPAAGKISRIHYEVGEEFRVGQSAVSMVTTGYKLFADVSELDIAKVRESNGNGIRVRLDAFPDKEFDGKVASVDAKEVIKTEDKYYRVNMAFDALGASIRSGMSADVTILASMKKGVLRVPELALYSDETGKYVKVMPLGMTRASSESVLKKVPVKTGITDGAFVEVLSGLTEGQIVVVSAE